MDQTTYDFLNNLAAYIQQSLSSISVPDTQPEPTTVTPEEPAISADLSRAKEKATEVNMTCGTPVLVEIIRQCAGDEAQKVSDVNPAHFNHFVRLCNEALAKHSKGEESAPLDPLS